jgi:16S rRNA (guanine527-N7)-methyltransferase
LQTSTNPQLFAALLAKLKIGIAALQLPQPISDAQCEQLIRYVELLTHWNSAYNLTAVRDPEEMISRHILDSLVIAPFITAKHLLDVGTGAGIPGIPLAIIKPEMHVDLLDSNGKKTRFLQQAKTELGLNNIRIFQARAEHHKSGLYTQIISRAFASLVDFVECTETQLVADGQWLAMKGQFPAEELQALADQTQKRQKTQAQTAVLETSHRLNVPGSEGERHLVVLSRQQT